MVDPISLLATHRLTEAVTLAEREFERFTLEFFGKPGCIVGLTEDGELAVRVTEREGLMPGGGFRWEAYYESRYGTLNAWGRKTKWLSHQGVARDLDMALYYAEQWYRDSDRSEKPESYDDEGPEYEYNPGDDD